MRSRVWGLVAMLVFVGAFSQGCEWFAAPSVNAGIRITPEIAFGPVQIQGEVFFTETVTVMYQGDSARLSLNGDGHGAILVDDVIDLDITRPNGTVIHEEIDFSDDCSHPIAPLDPIEIGHWLGIGENTITFTFRDLCGGGSGNTELWLVLSGTP